MKHAASQPMNIILLGDVGAGKATQSAYFAKKYRMFDFDMGRELTLLRRKNQQIDQTQQRTADKGLLTPTKIVREILQKKIHSIPRKQGILFDGHPKMIGEAKLTARLLRETGRANPLVLYLLIPRAESVKRVLARKGYDQTFIAKRSDDTIAGLNNRAKYYRDQISKVTTYFAKQYQFVCIDGLGTPTQVRARVQHAINEFQKSL
ncbi:MAG TPA: nucleoside monophosphate kinase [Candidatus Doudnabacteria bacterium]|nr:nucleoside monophosphate kinase [Candidatus Doudnabacteria bacterium]